ncbi:MAG TPA: phenylalanine--tRNA ligase beta subunit-related protein [Ktedonobacteraceae bacterium]|nr:phenylalanine--tRNA ligase beta subunit-related protein [Ktedonobacteraceae bacterium]
MIGFQYHPDILARYPTIVAGVMLARDMKNGPTPESLQTAFQAEQQTIIQRIGDTPLSQLPPLAAWRSVIRSFGVEPTQYRSAAEALLRRLTKKGDIPSINTLVDLANMVSIRYALPCAVFDTRVLQGVVTVHFASGAERYTTLKENEVDHPEPGEVVFSDETELVIARRWCWRQSEDSAATATTSSAIIVVEAHHANARQDITSALADLLELSRKYAGGDYMTAIFDKDHPALIEEM